MSVYYALVNVSAIDGSVEVLFGDYDRAVVEGEREAETCPVSGKRYNHVTDTEDKVRIVKFPAADDSLIQAYVDQINRPIIEAAQGAAAARQSIDAAWPVSAYDDQGKQVGLYKSLADAKRLKPGHTYQPAETTFIKSHDDQILGTTQFTAPAKPIAPAGTLVGTIPSAYPHLDAEGWDAARRHKMQFDTVTAEGIAAIPDVDLSAAQIRYAGIIGAIHVDRRSIPHRYRFSDVMEYAAARFAGDRPATVAHRHAKAAAK